MNSSRLLLLKTRFIQLSIGLAIFRDDPDFRDDLGEHLCASPLGFCSLSTEVWLRVAGIWLSREQVPQLNFAQGTDMHSLKSER